MQTRWKVTILTLAVAVPAFLLAAGSPQGESFWRNVWPWDMEMATEPTAGQVPFLMLVSVFESLALGLAVSFLVWGRKGVARIAGNANSVLLTAAAAWLLGSWWIHDNLHIVNGENFTGLIVLEYAFHVTLIASAAYLVWGLSRGSFSSAATSDAKAAAAPQTR